MVSAQSLHEKLNQYANGGITAELLEEWLVAESWDMRRYAPVGLQKFIEAVQAAFVDYADAKISEAELREYVLQRRDQLQRAHEATEKANAARPPAKPNPTLAESQAVIVFAVPVAV
jgi:hypothetical protein